MRFSILSISLSAFFLLFGGEILGLAQSNPTELADIYFTEDETDLDELQELIFAYQDNPLIWETCRIRDLRALPFNDHIKDRLIALKRSRIALSDWQNPTVDTLFTAAELEALQTFIRFSSKNHRSGQALNYLSIKNRDGVISLQKSLLRTRLFCKRGGFIGGVVENDQDEPQIWDYRNVTFRLPQRFIHLDIWGGAYRLQWGHGLLLASNLMSGRSTDVTENLNPLRPGIKNYLGADENRYLFGSAMNISARNLNLSAFLSRHRSDATTDDEGMVTNLRSDGLHISESQIQAKDILTESLAGMTLTYNYQGGTAGIMGYSAVYSDRIEMIDGRRNIGGVSCFHDQEIHEWSLNGEMAVQNNGGRAFIENVGINLEKLSISVGWRYFSPDFFAPLGSPFRKFGGLPANESGLYSGLKIRLRKRWWCSGYVDFFRRLESTQIGSEPANGCEDLIGISHSVGTESTLETWLKTTRYDQPIDIPAERQLKFHLRKLFTKNFTGEIRATLRWNDSIRIAEGGQAIGVVGRLALPTQTKILFGTTQYYVTCSDYIIYFYEPGLPSQFNLNNLSGSGQRYFLIVTRPVGTATVIAGALRWRQSNVSDNEAMLREISVDFQMSVEL
jgi:hypothetical protein